MQCYCGLDHSYSLCCEKYIKGSAVAPSAVALMRSRYSAYCVNDFDYILRTMLPPASLNFNLQQAKQDAVHINWLKLAILSSKETNSIAKVEFVAEYAILDKKFFLYEVSDFKKSNDKWFYTKGSHPKFDRNAKCWCQSNKKFKICCAQKS